MTLGGSAVIASRQIMEDIMLSAILAERADMVQKFTYQVKYWEFIIINRQLIPHRAQLQDRLLVQPQDKLLASNKHQKAKIPKNNKRQVMSKQIKKQK